MAPRPALWSRSRKYGVVIDAGSSGSRVQVYSWINPEVDRQQRKANGQSVDILSRVEKGVEHGDGWHMKVEPGISTFGQEPDQVGQYLKPLLDFAKGVIPTDKLPETRIYLLATAGMRLLPASERDAVLAEACSYIKSYPFRLDDCSEAVRVITGEEEGLYGWIAVNYLMDGFDKHEHAKSSKELARDSSTYGFLDMGGASTQIAFEPSETERIKHADNLLDVKLTLLSGKQVVHPVFVTTWLGFGTNQARERYIEQQIKAHERAASIDGSLDSERPSTTIDDPCLPSQLLLSEPRHPGYTLRGTGDFEQCVRRTGPLLNKEVECLDDPCLFNGVHVPAIDFSVNHFIGISEYWYSTQDVWTMGGVYDYVQFEKNAIEYCGRDWDDILAEHEAGTRWKPTVEVSRLETQCFKAAWIVNILHEGIGIPRIIDPAGEGDGRNQTEKATNKGVQKGLLARPPSFQSLNEVGDVAVSWTLGKMVLEVAKGELSEDVPTVPSSRFGNWRAHFPTWTGDVRETIGEVKEKPVPIAAVIIIAVVLWVYCVSPSAARRRKHLLAHARKKSDYALVRAEEDASSDSSTSNGGSSRRRSPSPNGFVAKLVSPLRRTLQRFSSSLRKSAKPSTGLLPSSSRMTALTNEINSYNSRPVPLRHVQSQPFLRSVPSSSSQIQHGNNTTFYLDAPDVSDRVLARSQSASILSSSQSHPPLPSSSSTNATGQTGIAVSATGTSTPPGNSLSRPSTPGGAIINRTVSTSSLSAGGSPVNTRLPPHRLAMSRSPVPPPPPSTGLHLGAMPAHPAHSDGSLTAGVWNSLGMHDEAVSPGGGAGAAGASGGGSAVSTPTGGAKLRLSTSFVDGGHHHQVGPNSNNLRTSLGSAGVSGPSSGTNALGSSSSPFSKSANTSSANLQGSGYFGSRPKGE